MSDLIAARLQLDGQRQFSSGAQQASKDVRGIGKAAEESSSVAKKSSGITAKSMIQTAAAAGVVYKGFGALKSSVNETVALSKSTSALKRATGLDAKQSQAWAVTAKQRGIETKTLQMGMAALSRSLGTAQDSSKGAGAALAKYGIDAKTLMALPMDLRMGMIADSFKAMPDGIEKAALAQKLFGRSGQQLLPLLNAGSKGLNEQLNMANKLVPPLGNSASQSLKLAAQQRQLQTTSMGLKIAMGSALLPILVGISTVLTPLISKFAQLMGQSKVLTYAVIGLAAAFVGLMVLSKVMAMFSALSAMLAANPFVLILVGVVALGVGLVMLYQKVSWFHNAVDAMAQGAVAAFNWVKNAAIAVFNWVKGNWPLLLGILMGPFGAAAAVIITHFGKIKSTAVNAFNTIKSAVSGVGSAVTNALVGSFNTVKSTIQGVIDTVNNLISSLKSIPSDILDKVKGGGIPFIPGIQHGTTNFPGGPALVGEAGPELVYLPQGANVIPNSMLGTTMAATINVPVYLDRRQIALATGQFYSDQAARQGEAR